jgi:mannose-6-phosphate isomerase-like protein (cupin superfamily)
MSIFPGRNIAVETHSGDQFIRIEKGTGIVVLNGIEYQIYDGVSINIPAGVKHYFKNTGSEDMKLYSIYSLPEHSPTKVQSMDPITGEIHTISE